jgi:MFS family permease
VGTLINRLGSFVMPFLALYLTTQQGISPSHAALVISLLGAGSFLAQLAGGELTDRLGRRPVMLMSFLVTPAVMAALGYARTLPIIAVLTFLAGFFTDLYRPAVSAAVADLVAPELRPRGYGYIYWAINLGAALAPVLAGFMATRSYLFLFLADAATTLVFGLIVLFFFRETRPEEAVQHTAQAGIGQRFSQLGRAPILLLFSLIILFFGMIYAQGNVTLPMDMASHGLGPDQYGWAISVNGFLIILTTITISNLAMKWPRFPTMAVAAILLGAGFGFTALASTFPLFAISVGIWTLGEILGTAVAPTIIADLSPIELRGLFQGIFGSAWGLAFFFGPLLGGWVYQTYGPSTLWLGALVLGLILSVAFLMLGRIAHPGTDLPANEAA